MSVILTIVLCVASYLLGAAIGWNRTRKAQLWVKGKMKKQETKS